MTTHTVASGGLEKVAETHGVGEVYMAAVDGADVRFSLTRDNADRGYLGEQGDRLMVAIPANSELRIYGDGNAQATVRLYPQGVTDVDELRVTLQAPKGLTIQSIASNVDSVMYATAFGDGSENPVYAYAATNEAGYVPGSQLFGDSGGLTPTPVGVDGNSEAELNIYQPHVATPGDAPAHALIRQDAGHETLDAVSLGSGATNLTALSKPGADRLVGRVVRETTSYDVELQIRDADDTTNLFTKDIATGVAAGTETAIDERVESPHVWVAVKDAGSGSGAVTATFYMR